jgi:hypothetical protein
MALPTGWSRPHLSVIKIGKYLLPGVVGHRLIKATCVLVTLSDPEQLPHAGPTIECAAEKPDLAILKVGQQLRMCAGSIVAPSVLQMAH